MTFLATGRISLASNKPIRSFPGRSVYWRFVWKEYRHLRAFWLAVTALTVGAQLVLMGLAPRPDIASAWLFASAWGAAALFAVGAAATLFAIEHEEETYGFLIGLPTTWAPVFWGKLSAAACGTGALLAAASLSGFVMGGFKWPESASADHVLWILSPAVLEALAWGAFFSLTLKRPLLAAVLAIATASLSVSLLCGLLAPGKPIYEVEAYRLAMVGRLVLASIVLLFNVLLAAHWLMETADFVPKLAWLPRRKTSSDVTWLWQATKRARSIAGQVRKLAPLNRLVWQSWRESLPTILVLIVSAVVSTAILLWIDPNQKGVTGTLVLIMLVAAPLALAPLAGACVFCGDQQLRRYRFLSEHAAPPRMVWLARHAVWLGVGGVNFGFAVLLVEFFGSGAIATAFQASASISPTERGVALNVVGIVLRVFGDGTGSAVVALLSMYAGGQLASMMSRSGLLAGFVAVLLATLLVLWMAILAALDMTPLYFVLPIATGMFLATWLWTPDWMLERQTWLAWLKPLGAVLVPVAIVFAAVPSARLAQLDEAQPQKQQLPFLRKPLEQSLATWRDGNTREARETADQYLRLSDEMLTYGHSWDNGVPNRLSNRLSEQPVAPQGAVVVLDILEANRDIVRQAIRISKRPMCRFPLVDEVFDRSMSYDRVEHLASLVELSARSKSKRGALKESLDRFLAVLRMKRHLRDGQGIAIWDHMSRSICLTLRQLGDWAAHDGQKSAALKDAIERLDAVWTPKSDPRQAVVAEYVLVSDVILERRAPRLISFDGRRHHSEFSAYVSLLVNKLPWERQRALRVMQAAATYNLHLVDFVQACLEGRVRDRADLFRNHLDPSEWGPKEWGRYPSWLVHPFGPWDWTSGTPWRWIKSSPLLRAEARPFVAGRWLANEFVREIARRRGLKVQLALIAYQLDHGDYPRQLDQLVPDYLTRLPNDPYTGLQFQWSGRAEPFRYEPDGLDGMLYQPATWDTVGPIPAHVPILWSPGYSHRPVYPEKNGSYEFDAGALVLPLPVPIEGAGTLPESNDHEEQDRRG